MEKVVNFYRCDICGNIVRQIHVGGGTLVCCGKPMDTLKANSMDASVEKHVPVVTGDDKHITVTIGSELHPMTEDHFIEFLYVRTVRGGHLALLARDAAPVAEFCICKEEVIEVYAYCNIHGLWVAPYTK